MQWQRECPPPSGVSQVTGTAGTPGGWSLASLVRREGIRSP